MNVPVPNPGPVERKHPGSAAWSATEVRTGPSRQLSANISTGTGATLINTGLTLAAHSIYVNFLGYRVYGVWLMLITIVTFLQVGNALFAGLTQMIAAEIGKNDRRGVGEVLGAGVTCAGWIGLTIVTVLLLSKHFALTVLFRSEIERAMAASLYPAIIIVSVFAVLVELVSAAVVGAGRLDLSVLVLLLSSVVTIATTIILLLLGTGSSGLVIGLIVGKTTQFAFLLLAMRKALGYWWRPSLSVRTSIFRRFLKLGSPIMAGNIMNLFLAPAAKALLTAYNGASSVAVYEIAYSGSMQIRAIFDSGVRALVPDIAARRHLPAHQSLPAIRASVRAAYVRILGLAFPLYLVIGIAAPVILRFWLRGNVQTGQAPALRILLVGGFFSLCATVPYCTVIGFAPMRRVFNSHLVQCVTSLGVMCAMLFILRGLSPMEASGASAVGMLVAFGYLFLEARSLTGKNFHETQLSSLRGEQPKEHSFSD